MGRALRLCAVAILGAAWGCFSAPAADVLFACEPDDAPQCPPKYTCQSDGCCHRDGTDVDASRNACNSGAEAGFGASTASETDATGTGADSEGSGGTGSESGSSSMTTNEAGTTGSSTGATSTSTGS